MANNYIKLDQINEFKKQLKSKYPFVTANTSNLLNKVVIASTHDITKSPVDPNAKIYIYKNKVNGTPDLTLSAKDVKFDQEGNVILHDEILIDKRGGVLMSNVAVSRDRAFYYDASLNCTEFVSALTGSKFTSVQAANINMLLHGTQSNIRQMSNIPENILDDKNSFLEVLAQIKNTYIEKVQTAQTGDRLESIVESFRDLTKSCLNQKLKHAIQKYQDSGVKLEETQRFIKDRLYKMEELIERLREMAQAKEV